LRIDDRKIPEPAAGEALIRVHAAAITRDELDWPTDRLPAIPSYEVSGVVEAVANATDGMDEGEAVFALTPFDRDGVAAEYAVVPAEVLAKKPERLSHVEASALPMGGLTAWQALFVHGALEPGMRVLILGATGGVGHLATQLAASRGAHVVAGATDADAAHAYGADEVLAPPSPDPSSTPPVDLLLDTVGGDALLQWSGMLRPGGRLVCIAEEPPVALSQEFSTTFFIVEPDGAQLGELSALADQGALRPAIDSVFAIDQARAAFERVTARGKNGKVVLEIQPDD